MSMKRRGICRLWKTLQDTSRIDGERRSQRWNYFLIYPTQFLIFLQLDFNLIVQPHFFQQLYNLIYSHRCHPILRIITMQFYTVSIKATRFVIIVPHFFFFFLSVYTILKFWEIFENSTKLVVSISPKSNTNQLW